MQQQQELAWLNYPTSTIESTIFAFVRVFEHSASPAENDAPFFSAPFSVVYVYPEPVLANECFSVRKRRSKNGTRRFPHRILASSR
jgi:hypothetical protein